MLYRTLGRTGLKVSQLGFGAMRLPMVGPGKDQPVDRALAIPMLHRAFELGVNYVDTAVGYCNQDSQRAVGEALKGWRDKVIVSTKNPYYGPDEKEWWTNLENSLARLNVSHIDIYNHHGINWKAYSEEVEPRMRQWMLKAHQQGLIKHICCSFHDNAEALKRIIDTGYVESITLQYNMLFRDLEETIAYAHEKNVGVVVMGPVAGGRLGVESGVLSELLADVARIPELALRFVLANPNVSLALSGMGTMQMVEENAAVASDTQTLRDGDRESIDQHLKRLKKLAELYCTGCGYCKPACEHGVDIPETFKHFNYGRVYGLWDFARHGLEWLEKKNKGPSTCVQCGACEEKCPQNIPIRQQLIEAGKAIKK